MLKCSFQIHHLRREKHVHSSHSRSAMKETTSLLTTNKQPHLHQFQDSRSCAKLPSEQPPPSVAEEVERASQVHFRLIPHSSA